MSSRSRKLPSKILVLGATSAIAVGVMRPLANRGAHFFLVARNEEKLMIVANDLTSRGAGSVTARVANLDDTGLHPGLLEEAAAALGLIELSFIAHGVLGNQEEGEASYPVTESIFRTNLLSPVSLITWLANYFQSTGQGTLAVISSVAGDRGRKSNYIYGATKGGLNIFLDGVRNRIDRDGVQVLTIRPGFVATPMTAHLRQGPLFATPEKVGQAILRAIESRKDIAYVPGFWALIMWIIRKIPEIVFKKLNF
jgi:decaprenylphospho-beta-D-erythro-pentofuranosid-2-ulose 2-reductase